MERNRIIKGPSRHGHPGTVPPGPTPTPMIKQGTELEKTQSLIPSILSMKSPHYQIIPSSPTMIMVIEPRRPKVMILGITPMIMPTGSPRWKRTIQLLENMCMMEMESVFRRLRIVQLPPTFIQASIQSMK
jgi:hypothetical protein